MPIPNSNYQVRLRGHLARYRTSALGVDDDGAWKGKPYGHILPKAEQKLNIVESIRGPFWSYVDALLPPMKLHADFAHLNSSQAFGFNLFFPIRESRKASDAFLKLLGLPAQPVTWTFEAIPDPTEGTNFDVVGLCTTGRILIEVKLTEAEFGTCGLDNGKLKAGHAKKLPDYMVHLTGKVDSSFFEHRKFAKHYQLLRNLSHLGPLDTLVLLVPRANTNTFTQATDFQRAVLPPWQERVRVLDAEAVVQNLATVPDVAKPMAEVAEKYFLVTAIE